MSDFAQFAVIYIGAAFAAVFVLAIYGEDVDWGGLGVKAEGRFVLTVAAALVWPLLLVALFVRAAIFVGCGIAQVWRALAPPPRVKLPKATAQNRRRP